MASISIIADNAPYYLVEVVCGEQRFVQNIILTGDDIQGALDNYAREYEEALYTASL